MQEDISLERHVVLLQFVLLAIECRLVRSFNLAKTDFLGTRCCPRICKKAWSYKKEVDAPVIFLTLF
ncbi:hypothetical protein P029_03125 [Anaplasma phagocytophilum str. Norway variant2]|uniref:Uncharacterized protein n=1 Tax=Anaplasma phagocytophilum str. Norway variant2 TaxID=1392507 RepID=A0A161IQZ6_ANAPH|nr:hypothetical protein P029_03125 [Anaplasma phagocytophilum str. Norway variant2]